MPRPFTDIVPSFIPILHAYHRVRSLCSRSSRGVSLCKYKSRQITVEYSPRLLLKSSKIDICGIVQVEAATRTRWRQAETRKPDRKEWRSWSKRSRAPSARTTSKSPRSFPAFTTTARDVSRRWPREQVAPTNPFPVQSVAPPPSYLKATLTSCKPPSLSTE